MVGNHNQGNNVQEISAGARSSASDNDAQTRKKMSEFQTLINQMGKYYGLENPFIRNPLLSKATYEEFDAILKKTTEAVTALKKMADLASKPNASVEEKEAKDRYDSLMKNAGKFANSKFAQGNRGVFTQSAASLVSAIAEDNIVAAILLVSLAAVFAAIFPDGKLRKMTKQLKEIGDLHDLQQGRVEIARENDVNNDVVPRH
ncbi:MAG: hypothetical protein COB50_00225 [Thiotrichales bacterium]|nr:MAG: hypothetical protein COB50_00225 [Thiotrichales bacterium]